MRTQPRIPRPVSFLGKYKWIMFTYLSDADNTLLRLHEGDTFRNLLHFLQLFRMFSQFRSFIHLGTSCPRCEKELDEGDEGNITI
jgi:hypothetical protein